MNIWSTNFWIFFPSEKLPQFSRLHLLTDHWERLPSIPEPTQIAPNADPVDGGDDAPDVISTFTLVKCSLHVEGQTIRFFGEFLVNGVRWKVLPWACTYFIKKR